MDWLESGKAIVPFDMTPIEGIDAEFQRARVTRALIDAAIAEDGGK